MRSFGTEFFLVVALIGLPADIIAQSRPTSASATSPSGREKAGKYLFLQRCSLCHLAPYSKTVNWTEPDAVPPPIGPRLAGSLNMTRAEEEKAVRDFILKGSRDMPGWQYALDANQIDELIDYLKSLQKVKSK